MTSRMLIPSAVLCLALGACASKTTANLENDETSSVSSVSSSVDDGDAQLTPAIESADVAEASIAPEPELVELEESDEEAPAAVQQARTESAPAAEPSELAAAFEGAEMSSDLSGGIGGLIGAKGTQVGSGGLGSHGSGLGGGGAAEGLGGLGTRGRGSGTSGYGAGAAVAKSARVSASASVARPAPPPAQVYDSYSANTEDYTNYGVNDMTIVAEDAQSTFSIDVDTASYTIARRKLQEGALPPTASVRVEEFVNYFDYDYVGPTGDAPFAVNMEAAPHPFESTHHLLRVGVQGKEIDDAERKPVRLTFLVDTSGSMSSSDKLPLAKRAIRELVDNLGPEDTVALATYAGSTKAVLQPTPADQRSVIYDALESLSSGGGTAMGSGMDTAYQMASSGYVHGAENRVIVLSDGDANIGRTSHEEILRTIKQHAEEGITLSTIGFGMGNYKDTMMEQLANQGDGNYYYVDSYSEAQKVFGEDLSGTLQVIAKDVKIQVEFNPDAVYAYRLVGYENRDIADRDFRNDRVDAGEIGAGHQVTAVYDVVLRDDYRGHDVATVRMRNKKPGPDSPAVEWNTTFPSELVHGEFADASDDMRLAYGAATFAELLRDSPYAAEISYAQVWNVVKDAQRRGESSDAELLGLIEDAGQLAGERGSVAWR